MLEIIRFIESQSSTGPIIKSLMLCGIVLSLISIGVFSGRRRHLAWCFGLMFLSLYIFPTKLYNYFPLFVLVYLIIQKGYNGLFAGSLCIFPISILFFSNDLDILYIELMLSSYLIALYYVISRKHRHPVFSVYLVLCVNSLIALNLAYLCIFTFILFTYLVTKDFKSSWYMKQLNMRRPAVNLN